jgi:hypothetical protein
MQRQVVGMNSRRLLFDIDNLFDTAIIVPRGEIEQRMLVSLQLETHFLYRLHRLPA